MELRTLLAEIDPHWFDGQADDHNDDGGSDDRERHAGERNAGDDAATEEAAIPAPLLSRARESRLGRRMMARWLATDHASTLLAPTLDDDATPVVRWPRSLLARLTRDLGALAYAPVIRAEVRREPVRRIKRALGNSYLLALDRSVWDGRVADATIARLAERLDAALAADSQHDGGHDGGHENRNDTDLLASLDHQGRSELQAWAATHDRALGEWVRLLHPREPRTRTHLPEASVQTLHAHHAAKSHHAATTRQMRQ